ncbi:hypothetical protein QA612_09850 [Evansella sp. AB-P1]|uniref:hypothetical protein n=1 Tax=Evansella sp. AB-P1 TaxID=3037653 RepID=UPI00241C77BA|nr:hypothetical protein [Evansella sp. AB-P1]MDG5787802.1 hypothetical protein [Evansella sp. AB-P1]
MKKDVPQRIAYYTKKVAEKAAIHPAIKPPRSHKYRQQRLIKYKAMLHQQISDEGWKI